MEKKIKVLMLADHPLSTSGVGCQARWLIEGLLRTERYSFLCLGGAIRHENYDLAVVNDDFLIKPVDGFGNRNLIRNILGVEKPDVLMLFTDPRFFIWAWEMEDEIHSVCPIAYWHLWDNPPYPEFNSVLYESTDLLNCINWPTYEMVKERFPEKTNYVPHSLPKDIFFKVPDEDRLRAKINFLGYEKKDHFVGMWVSRNARRKMPSDVIISWSKFLDWLQRTHGHKNATLVMHTDPKDEQGPNLNHIIDVTGTKGNVFFSTNRIGFSEMNLLYNVADFTMLRSSNEGFGLSTLESLYTETPIIALKTGGQTRQVVNWKTGEENGVALDVEVSSLAGNQLIPYIYEDYVSHETVTKAIIKMYEFGDEKRNEIGKRGRAYALEEYNYERMIRDWDETLVKLVSDWKMGHRNWKGETL